MAVGLSAAIVNDILDALGNNSSITTLPFAEFWLQLHTGDPGASGTANVAGNATRKQVSFGSPAAPLMSNDAAVSWTAGEVDTSEDYTHWSAHSAAAAGTFICSGTVSANAVVTADTFTIPTGEVDLTLSTAA